MVEKTLVMGFKNELGKRYNINIKEVVESLNEADVNTLMDLIIEKNLILTEGGALKEKVEAEIITKESNSVNVA